MLRQAEQVVADFRKQLMESFSMEEVMRDFQQQKLWNEFINDPFGWGEAESRNNEVPERLPFTGSNVNDQNDYQNQYNKEPKSIGEFVERFDGMTYNEIIIGEE